MVISNRSNSHATTAYWNGIHNNVWDVSVREELPCMRENGNEKDPYAVVVTWRNTFVSQGRYQLLASYFCRRRHDLLNSYWNMARFHIQLKYMHLSSLRLLLWVLSMIEKKTWLGIPDAILQSTCTVPFSWICPVPQIAMTSYWWNKIWQYVHGQPHCHIKFPAKFSHL